MRVTFAPSGLKAGLALVGVVAISCASCSTPAAAKMPVAAAKMPRPPTTSANAAAAMPPPLPDAPVDAAPTPPAVAPVATPAPATTSCTDLLYVGDSTSIGLVSASFLPDADDRLGTRYKAVGVTNFIPEISGARSMVETLRNQPNATTVATRMRDAGYKGCWVFALGTNDPANVAGDVGALSRRIDAMMKRVGDMPVMWATSKTLVTHGPYRNTNMEGWNRAVRDACNRYPNMRVYDWASEAKESWFLADGIHPNSAGCKAKASGFAKAVVAAFPAGRAPSASCLVRSTP